MSPVLEGFITILHEHGPGKIPPAYRQQVIDAEWERICDPEVGFAYFWLWYAMVQIKGRRKRGEAHDESRFGWQRACPDGKPRVDASGRSWYWQYLVALEVILYDLLLILKARQIGMSFEFGNLVIWAAITAKEQQIAVIANKLQSAERLQRRARTVYHKLPAWMRDRVKLTNPAIRRMEFSNGSVAEPYSGDPNSARSEAATWVFVDEVGEIERLYEFYAATESVAEGEGCHFILFGTAKNNGLEAWCIDGDAGDVLSTQFVPDAGESGYTIEVKDGINGMAFMFLPYFLHPARDEAWMERKRKTYKGNLANLDQEYPSTWQMAFNSVGGKFFNDEARKRQIEVQRPIWEERDRRGTILPDPSAQSGYKFVDDPYGHVVIHATHDEWQDALSNGRPWCAGADCAGDRPSGDYHAAAFINLGVIPEPDTVQTDVIPHRLLLTIHGHMDADHYAELLVRAGYLCNRALLAIEVNGLGVGVLKPVVRMRYPAIYKRRTAPTNRHDKSGHEYGWYSLQSNKGMAYGETERLLRNDWIEIRDHETLDEMGQILTLGSGKLGARDPKHDDRSDALTIAIGVSPYVRGVLRYDKPTDEEEAPFWSLARAFEQLPDPTKAGIIGNEMGRYMAAGGV